MKKIKVDKEEVDRQWEEFEWEYSIEDPDEMDSDGAADVLRRIRSKFKRCLSNGMFEVIDDPEKGLTVKQFLNRPVKGIPDGFLLYKSPGSADIADAGFGKRDDDTANALKHRRLTASLTGVAETILEKVIGGDRSRMESLCSLFLHV